MAGIDKCLNDKEIRKRNRETEAGTSRLRVRDQKEVNQELAYLSEIMDSNKKLSLNDGFQVPSTSTNMKKARKIIKVFTEDIVASLDHVNMSDQNLMFIVEAVAQTLGTPVSDISLSRSTTLQSISDSSNCCRNRQSFFFFSISSYFALG
jgi:hypothetical protein